MGYRRSSSFQGQLVMVKVTGDKRFEHSLPTDLETLLYYAGVVMFYLICRYIIRIARPGVSVRFTHWVKVRVTGYHHTSILSTTVADPDKYSKTYGGGPRVTDPGWRL